MYPIYRILSYLCWPLLRILPYARVKKGKEIRERISERFGPDNQTRPKGKLVWIHAASNGESLSALPLIHALQELPSAPTILVTTMTVSSAKLMEKRLPETGCIHQFIPYDHPSWVRTFQNFWKPDMAIWIESELWPNHLKELKNRNIPTILANARLSRNSMQKWALIKPAFIDLMKTFSLILAQTPQDKEHFEQLGAQNCIYAGNLKEIALPLPYDQIALDDMKLCIGNRPVMLFASTHKGEEQIAMDVHTTLKSTIPNLLTIILPRHPRRADEISKIATSSNLNLAQRSLKMSPRTDTDIYLADTLGELGLFYKLCPVAFIGNSLDTKPGGGHNLLEPALLDCVIVTGPSLFNFSVQAKEMPKSEACIIVETKEELAPKIKDLLNDKARQTQLAENAYAYASEKQALGLDKILTQCEKVFESARLI